MTIELPTDALRTAIAGEVVLPSHATYDESRATFNGTIDKRPAVIAMPRSTADVVAAVLWARDVGLPIAVRGGGHSVAGHGVAEGALVIDLRAMREVTVDPARQRTRVGGGALWEDVDRAAFAHGMAMPGGTFGDTGVGGLTLGGGLGFLMGTSGLTCDVLVRAEVVTADGSVVIAGEGGDPELLWALRGGGGNFGVVTEFEFALQRVGSVYTVNVFVPLSSATDALNVIAELARTAPPELAIFVSARSQLIQEGATEPDTDAPFTIHITGVYQGSQEDAESVMHPVLALPRLGQLSKRMTYLEAQDMNGRLPFGLRHYWKGHFLGDLDDVAIAATVRAVASATGHSFVLLEAITGVARTEPDGGAAFGQREARWNVSGLAIWEDPTEDAEQIGWVRDLADALKPSSLTGAGYANYAPPDETPDRVRAAFGPARFDRLARVKRRHDPDNTFCFNLNIPPAADSA